MMIGCMDLKTNNSPEKIVDQNNKLVDIYQVNEIVAKAREEFTAQIVAVRADFKRDIEADKATLTTVFGLFASITSFLTIEFQFLKTLSDLKSIVGFSILMFSLLFSFNIALDYLIKSRIDKEVPKPNYFFMLWVMILFAIGIAFMFFGNEEKYRESKIYQRFVDDNKT
jgi:hypothetical protein